MGTGNSSSGYYFTMTFTQGHPPEPPDLSHVGVPLEPLPSSDSGAVALEVPTEVVYE